MLLRVTTTMIFVKYFFEPNSIQNVAKRDKRIEKNSLNTVKSKTPFFILS